MLFYGFDPGGDNSFGWAVVGLAEAGRAERIETGIARDARSAICSAYDAAEYPLTGAGIDAPQFWVSSGDRHADASVRSDGRQVLASTHWQRWSMWYLTGGTVLRGSVTLVTWRYGDEFARIALATPERRSELGGRV